MMDPPGSSARTECKPDQTSRTVTAATPAPIVIRVGRKASVRLSPATESVPAVPVTPVGVRWCVWVGGRRVWWFSHGNEMIEASSDARWNDVRSDHKSRGCSVDALEHQRERHI